MHQVCPYCQGRIAHQGKGCPKRPRSGRRKPRRILSWDCEVIEDRIVLFLCSDADKRKSYLYDPAGISIELIFAWMIDTGKSALNISFFFNYDVNQMVRQLPPAHLDQLRSTGRVTWRRWNIRHIPGKRFSVQDRLTRESITIWDVSGWVQCSLVRLVEDWQIGTVEERSYIAAMKAKRADLSSSPKDTLVRYTTLECALLCEWMKRNLALHKDTGIHLRSYSGAGSTAAALLRRQGFAPPEVPAEVQKAAEAAFFGGRSETSMIGPAKGPIYGYDINSAYPAALARMPELHGARWHRTKRYEPGAWGFYRIRWSQPASACWGAFPMRGAPLPGGKRSISLLYPITGTGWYHSYEIQAALDQGVDIDVRDGWITDPRGRPFDWVAELAAERLQRKAAGDPTAFVLKVGLNSLYGKMAQHSGTHPMQSMVYASAITSATRARLLSLMIPAGHDIILVATDGILARRPLPVTVSPALGDWEMSVYPDAWILQAGIYWAGNKIRTRGIDDRELDFEQIALAWRRYGTRGFVRIETRRVMSYRIASIMGKHQDTGTWVTNSRLIRFSPRPRRRSWRKDPAGAMLTLPAEVDAYMIHAMMDEFFLAESPIWQYDEEEAMPHWSLRDE